MTGELKIPACGLILATAQLTDTIDPPWPPTETLATVTIPAGSIGPDGRLPDEVCAELMRQLRGRAKP